MTKIKKHYSFLRLLTLSFLLAILVGGLIIKFDTPLAAQFADNVLRPLIGDNIVIFLEKVVFNVSDKVQMAGDKFITPNAPIFIDQNGKDYSLSGGLDVTPLKTDPTMIPLVNEGKWKGQSLSQFLGEDVLAHTFIRPDSQRPYAVVTLLQIDSSKIGIGSEAGIKQPGGPVGIPGPGVIPSDIIKQNRLVAAFEGGFQYRDGQYGMIVGDTTYLPLKPDLGTIIGFKDGSFKIFNYQSDLPNNEIAFIRQNCPILIENGNLSVSDPKNKHLWGRTPTTAIYTWRSGIGVNARGNLLYAVGNNLTPETLAQALKIAGATEAMQLDINPFWVRFSLFNLVGDGKYKSSPLTKDLKDGGSQYLNGEDKDFFYLYKR